MQRCLKFNLASILTDADVSGEIYFTPIAAFCIGISSIGLSDNICVKHFTYWNQLLAMMWGN